jgi:hypothetical protein
MHHLYKGTAKYYPWKPGERLRAFRPDSDEGYDEQWRNWEVVRKDLKAAAEEAKKKWQKGSYHVSRSEKKNLESSLGGYWAL